MAQLVAAGSAAQSQLPSDACFLWSSQQAAHLQSDRVVIHSNEAQIRAKTICATTYAHFDREAAEI